MSIALREVAQKWLNSIPHSTASAHGRSNAEICLKSINRDLLGIYSSFVKQTVSNAGGLTKEQPVPRYELKRWTVLSSPFIHKKARTQLERRVYPKIFEIYNMDLNACKTLLWYISRNAPPSIDITAKIRI